MSWAGAACAGNTPTTETFGALLAGFLLFALIPRPESHSATLSLTPGSHTLQVAHGRSPSSPVAAS